LDGLLEQLGQNWIPSVPDVHVRLMAEPPARVAEVGCGVGWASIGLARAYGRITVDGYDLDAPSINQAHTGRHAWRKASRLT
jgi:2-polyprenyl-3-methyl-5-hydroxy-6-metoxy-1,4-benzoquinol methylase